MKLNITQEQFNEIENDLIDNLLDIGQMISFIDMAKGNDNNLDIYHLSDKWYISICDRYTFKQIGASGEELCDVLWEVTKHYLKEK